MNASNQSLKKPALIAIAALGILLIGAIIFFKERLFADTSFIAFKIINYKNLAVQDLRYGSFITQIVPYFGQKLHLPLTMILMSYAISFNLFYFIVACLLVCKLKQYELAILTALFYFLFVTDSYFWPINEINQAIAWMFLFFGVTLYLGKKKVNILVLLIPYSILAFLTVSTHFVAVIPTVFLWTYFWIEKKEWPFPKRISILLTCILIAVIGIRYSLANNQQYDAEHLHDATHFSLQDIIDSFTTPVIQIFLYRCVSIYWPAIIIFILSLISLVRNKQNILAVWTVLSVVGYFILMGLTYGKLDGKVQLFHIESEWTCIGIIIATPFVFGFLPKLKPSVAIALLTIVFITRLAYISASIPAFSGRIQMQDRILSQMRKKNIPKLALYMDTVIWPKYILDWTSVYESLFSSAMNGDKPQLTFCFVNRDDMHTLELIKNTQGFYDAYNIVPPGSLNQVYFNVDTLHPYQVMTYRELFK